MTKHTPPLRNGTEVRDIIPLSVIVHWKRLFTPGNISQMAQKSHHVTQDLPPKKTQTSYSEHRSPNCRKFTSRDPDPKELRELTPLDRDQKKIWRPLAMNTNTHEFTDLLCWDQDPK